MKTARTGLLVLALAAGPVLGLQDAAVAKTSTKTQIYGSEVNSGKEKVDAALTKGNQQGISGKKLVFKYYKKVSGDWKLKDTKSGTTSGLGLASASFDAVSGKRCKVTAKFGGTAKLAASKDAWVIKCNTGAQV